MLILPSSQLSRCWLVRVEKAIWPSESSYWHLPQINQLIAMKKTLPSHKGLDNLQKLPTNCFATCPFLFKSRFFQPTTFFQPTKCFHTKFSFDFVGYLEHPKFDLFSMVPSWIKSCWNGLFCVSFSFPIARWQSCRQRQLRRSSFKFQRLKKRPPR